jgi:hypothetical protein
VLLARKHAGPAGTDRLSPGLRISLEIAVPHGTRAFWPTGVAAQPRRHFGQKRLLLVQQ